MEKKVIKADSEAKASGGLGLQGKILKGGVYQAAAQARDIVEGAQRRAESIISSAERERDAVLEESRERGYQEGVARWNDVLQQACHARDRFLNDSEAELVRLAVRVAGKIIGEEIRSDPEAILRIVRETLKSVRQERSLTLQVHPKHLEAVRRQLGQLEQELGAACSIRVLANPSVGEGGCVIESELGVIDARLETQLKCLEEALSRVAGR
jgi:type III secretion protein L